MQIIMFTCTTSYPSEPLHFFFFLVLIIFNTAFMLCIRPEIVPYYHSFLGFLFYHLVPLISHHPWVNSRQWSYHLFLSFLPCLLSFSLLLYFCYLFNNVKIYTHWRVLPYLSLWIGSMVTTFLPFLFAYWLCP